MTFHEKSTTVLESGEARAKTGLSGVLKLFLTGETMVKMLFLFDTFKER